MDSDSNATIFFNENYVTDIWDVNDSISIDTNSSGRITSRKKYMFRNLVEHWFNKYSVTNILSLSDVADKYRITLDTEKERVLRVYFLRKIVKFKELNFTIKRKAIP